jgi:hypothetical protein
LIFFNKMHNSVDSNSHRPGRLSLLPALPSALGEAGHVYGLRARGDVGVSMHWRGGKVLAAAVVFRSAHPWLSGLRDLTWSKAMQAERDKRIREGHAREESVEPPREGGREQEQSEDKLGEGAAMRGFHTAAEQPFPASTGELGLVR